MKPPTVEEVRAYVAEKGYTFDPWLFVEKNTANEWTYGKDRKPLKTWKGACATWQKRERDLHRPGMDGNGNPYPSRHEIAEFNRKMVGVSQESYRVAFEKFFGVKLLEEKL
jgi:hypothetical protein